MPEQYNLQPTPTLEPAVETKSKNFHLILLIGVPVLFLVFFLGLVLGKLSSPKPNSAATSSGTPEPSTTQVTNTQLTPVPTTVSDVPSLQFLPNKQYFDDTYVVITQDKPHQALVLSVSRIEQTRAFSEYTKVNYFDGKTWTRKSITATTNSNSVVLNPMLRGWTQPTNQVTSNPPQLATVQLENQTLSFSSTDLQDEISIQSTPGSTKFIYQGTGTLVINSQPYPAYVFYGRTYSFNAIDLSYLATPGSMISNWLIFWDKEGSFYYLDDHQPVEYNQQASFFKIGLQEDARRTVTKTTSYTVDSLNQPTKPFSVKFSDPIYQDLSIQLTNAIDKADSKKYSWIEAVNEGTIVKREGRTVQGLGLVEYIRPN